MEGSHAVQVLKEKHCRSRGQEPHSARGYDDDIIGEPELGLELNSEGM